MIGRCSSNAVKGGVMVCKHGGDEGGMDIDSFKQKDEFRSNELSIPGCVSHSAVVMRSRVVCCCATMEGIERVQMYRYISLYRNGREPEKWPIKQISEKLYRRKLEKKKT